MDFKIKYRNKSICTWVIQTHMSIWKVKGTLTLLKGVAGNNKERRVTLKGTWSSITLRNALTIRHYNPRIPNIEVQLANVYVAKWIRHMVAKCAFTFLRRFGGFVRVLHGCWSCCTDLLSWSHRGGFVAENSTTSTEAKCRCSVITAEVWGRFSVRSLWECWVRGKAWKAQVLRARRS